MYKLNITKDAENDLDLILDYITNSLCSPVAATHLANDILDKFKRISENPHIYEFYPDPRLEEKGYRKVTVKNYMVFYIVDEENKTVNIMRVIYGRRDHSNLIQ